MHQRTADRSSAAIRPPFRYRVRAVIRLFRLDRSDREEIAYAGLLFRIRLSIFAFRRIPLCCERSPKKRADLNWMARQTPLNWRHPSSVSRTETQHASDVRLVSDALACMIPLDVAIRRVQIDLLAGRSIREHKPNRPPRWEHCFKSRNPSGRQSTNAAKTRRHARKHPHDQCCLGLHRPRPNLSKDKPTESTAAAAGKQTASTDDGGTTSRLLAMKRRREDGGRKNRGEFTYTNRCLTVRSSNQDDGVDISER